MIITYFGKQFFKIQQGEMVIAFNPVSKSSKSGISAKFGADIALITTNHLDYNGVEQLSHGDRVPFAISGPGDYEVKEIFVKGIMSNSELSGKKYINTIYSLSVDNISIAFLGALSDSEISKEAREAIDGPDILFVPVGGKGLLDAKSSAKLASSLEPKMIIPMDYDSASLKAFLKEIGEEKAEVVDKLTLKRKDLEGKEGEIVVLSAIG
ncbi:MAG: MBL fold metallo-hydrolase [Candidatus Paceibacterota bacterium]|jgi:L-ascorbate metabolism protein UlaG (beta-lactamase superfamily)